ncbi:hypothetical protein V1264_019134 [Littorina saxatilis]|uniref:Uncharacterized protein n=1 Tax=Littorina saxatilis TaxID=31220 RepID=A0AAN9BFX5_9CAEN
MFFISELTEQQQSLTERLKQQEEHLRNCAAARRLYEADSQKVEHWCHETDITCSTELPSDCASEVLEEKVKQYKVSLGCTSYFAKSTAQSFATECLVKIL